MVLYALDSGDKFLYGLLRSYACIPVSPDGIQLAFIQDLINPTSQLAVLYSKGKITPSQTMPHFNLFEVSSMYR